MPQVPPVLPHLRMSRFLLGFKDLSNPLDAVGVFGQFVRPQAHDARKTQGVTAVVSIGLHHVVERDFQNDLRLDQQAHALIFERMLDEPPGHF